MKSNLNITQQEIRMKKYAIGTDIGGSHISAVLIDIENKSILTDSFSNHKVNNKDSAETILQNWVFAIEQSIGTKTSQEISGIGFAMPGPFDYANGIAKFTHEVAKFENLNGVDVGFQMRKLLGFSPEQPIRFMNDATSFAVGETWIGSASDYSKTIAITLGTGFGSAFIEAGIPVLSRKDVPKLGCLWHLPFRDGIADDYFSTRWYINRYAKETGKTVSGVRDVAELAVKDPIAANLFIEFGANLGEFLGPWIAKFDAQNIVIGGNMVKAWELFGSEFKQSLTAQNVNANICLSELGETAAMIGSARLIDESFWNQVKPLLPEM
jgi:glucokinase